MKNKLRFFVVISSMSKKYNIALNYIKKTAKLAYLNGADGIFLIPDQKKSISLKAKESDLITFYKSLEKIYKKTDFKIGVNFLFPDYKSVHLEKIISNNNLKMVQTSSLLFDKIKFPNTEIFTTVEFNYSMKGLDIIGEDFKKVYKEIIKNNTIVNLISREDYPFLVSNIRNVRSYLRFDSRLALANGVDVHNIQSFIDAGVTDFLIATSLIKGVENDFDILDGEKISEISRIIKENNSKI